MAYPGSIIAIEGPNEVNNFAVNYEGLTGTAGAQAFQADLYAAVNASPILQDIPVYGLTSWPNVTNDSDFANFHSYPDHGDYSTWRINTDMSDEQAANPGKPIVLTEAGYHTLLGPLSREGVDDAIQAKMVTSMFFDAFDLGVSKTFTFQLLDQYTDQSNPEAHYGLFGLDFHPKPAADALHNLTTILDDQGGAAAPGSLEMALSGMPSTGHSLLLQQADGDFDLAVWNEPDV